MLFRGPPFASSSASVFCWRGFFLDSPTLVALLAGSLRSASPVLFSVSGLGALVPVVQVCLQAASVFCLVDGSLSVALSGAPGFQSFFSFSSAQISLSLSLGLSCSSLSPLGFYWLGLVSVLATFVLGLSLAISWWPTYWYPCVSFRVSSSRSFPPSWWGLALLLRWTYFQSILLVCPGRSLLFLALFSAFCQVLVRCLLSSLWLGWCSASFPAALHPVSSLYGQLAVSPFLMSRFVAVRFPGL